MSIVHTIHDASQAWDLAGELQVRRGSYPALCALFHYMEEVAAGEPIEFDPVGWAREFSTWETAAACCEDCRETYYAELVEENESYEGDEDTLEQLCLDYLGAIEALVYSGVDGVVIKDF